mmetsp:Transcript_19171/g.39526  ORF Transcript_19171/g.39526 Transcript_19171/m.39526 type:complete len:242 (-) Transcript_19171:8962-9687(-)
MLSNTQWTQLSLPAWLTAARTLPSRRLLPTRSSWPHLRILRWPEPLLTLHLRVVQHTFLRLFLLRLVIGSESVTVALAVTLGSVMSMPRSQLLLELTRPTPSRPQELLLRPPLPIRVSSMATSSVTCPRAATESATTALLRGSCKRMPLRLPTMTTLLPLTPSRTRLKPLTPSPLVASLSLGLATLSLTLPLLVLFTVLLSPLLLEPLTRWFATPLAVYSLRQTVAPVPAAALLPLSARVV